MEVLLVGYIYPALCIITGDVCFDAPFRVTLFNKKLEQNVCLVSSRYSLPTIMRK